MSDRSSIVEVGYNAKPCDTTTTSNQVQKK